MSKLLTPGQIEEMRAYWTLDPKARDERFGKWPLRHARDDIQALCDHIAERDQRIDERPT